MDEPSSDALTTALRIQIQHLVWIRRQQDERLRLLVADQVRQLDLIEQQNELLLSLSDVYQQRLEEAAVLSFGLDHENIELRQRVRDLESTLARDSGDKPMGSGD